MIGALGHESALLRLYWAGDNLGECQNRKRGEREDMFMNTWYKVKRLVI